MARIIRDAAGIEWTVYETAPSASERRAQHLAEAYRNGWLVFESSAEKRRLAPVPAGWEELSDSGLATLCESAVPQPVHRRATAQAEVRDQRSGRAPSGSVGAHPPVLRHELDEVTTQLDETLEQVCEQRADEESSRQLDTGELIRVEETLATAAEMAKQAVTLRRKMRSSDPEQRGDADDEHR